VSKKKQRVPPMRELDRDVVDEIGPRSFVAEGKGYDVFSWSPGKAGEGVPSTQVHVVFGVLHGIKFVLRLKSARALDELVGVLLQHRSDVWPSEPKGGAS
jgi:hypothetical protein